MASFVSFRQRLVQKFTSGAKIHQVGEFLHQPSKAASIYLKKAKRKREARIKFIRRTFLFLKLNLFVGISGKKGRTRFIVCFRASGLVDDDDTAFRQFSFGAVNDQVAAAGARIIINFR